MRWITGRHLPCWGGWGRERWSWTQRRLWWPIVAIWEPSNTAAAFNRLVITRCCGVSHLLHGKVAPPWEFIFLENTRSSTSFLISLSPNTPEECKINECKAKVTQCGWCNLVNYKHWITHHLIGSFFLWCKIEVWIGKDIKQNLDRKLQ